MIFNRALITVSYKLMPNESIKVSFDRSSFVSYNRGQNSLGQMFFSLKEAFPVCKLLPFTANTPLPPIAMLVAERRHTCQLIYEVFISFQHCNGGVGGGISTRNFFQNTKCIMSFVRDCLKGLKTSGAHNSKTGYDNKLKFSELFRLHSRYQEVSFYVSTVSRKDKNDF